MARSRLSKNREKETKKNLLFTSVGIFLILALLIKFGPSFLLNMSLFISGNRQSQDLVKNDTVFIAVPVLDPLPNATKSAEVNVSGKASFGQTVNLYVNNQLVDKTKVKKDDTFSFDHVSLLSEQNIVKTKAVNTNGKTSNFSDSISIQIKSKEPSLTVEEPKDGQSFSKDQNSITVKGKTDAGVKVTINDFWAIVDEKGIFSYTFSLKQGDNQLKVIATDEAGNKKEANLKVSYSP